MKKYLLKILAVMVAVAGIPVGVLLSRGLKTRWGNGYVNIAPPDAIHWHVAIGIWLAFALIGLFIWYLNKLIEKPQEKPAEILRQVRLVSVIIQVAGFVLGLLIGLRIGGGIWAPEGTMVPLVMISPTLEGFWVAGVWILFYVLGKTLSVLAKRYENRNQADQG